jgi:hypothetical protein
LPPQIGDIAWTKGIAMDKNLLWSAALAATLLLGANAAVADDDPPGRVGRLSYIEGTASFHAADDSQWSPATLNYPVFAGAFFWTEPGSRVELQVGSSEIRLDESTEIEIVALDDRSTQLWLGQGVLNLHLASMPPGGVRVLTPRSEIELVEPGTYHIDAGANDGTVPPTWLSVTTLDGKAEVSGPGSRIEVLPGENAVLNGDPMAVTLSEAGATPFDDWALQRERREVARETVRYVSPEETGYQDLDDYGRWSRDPGYGAVWYPRDLPPDWVPYRYGHWAFIPPWTWTWVDDAPWGFAPSHYGRWAEIRGRWAWCPGEREARPVYAPALVAFIGGDGFGVTIAAGPAQPAVGWVPLAPGEAFHPHYRSSPDYVRNVNRTQVNITNVTNVTVVNNVTVNNFANQRGATVVPSGAFTHAAPVQRATVAVPHEELAQAHLAPNLSHLQPSAAARAGVAVVPAAAVSLPHPNAPANLAKTPITPAALPAAQNEPAPPSAPGPHGRELRQTHLPPATLQQQAPTQHGPAQQLQQAPPAQTTTVTPSPPPNQGAPHHDTALDHPVPTTVTPPSNQGPPPHDTAVNHPVTTTVTPPPPPTLNQGQPHRDTAINHPVTTTVTPPPPPAAAVTPSNQGQPHHDAAINHPVTTTVTPPPPPSVAVVTPPKPPLAPIQHPAQQTQLAPTPQGWARTPPPSPAGQPANAAKDKGKDKKDEHKQPGN